MEVIAREPAVLVLCYVKYGSRVSGIYRGVRVLVVADGKIQGDKRIKCPIHQSSRHAMVLGDC